MKWFWLGVQILLAVLLLAAGFVYLTNQQIGAVARGKAQTSITEIEQPQANEAPRVAIVFGAGVWSNGEPSPALEDRIITAVELYRSGRARKLLMSGDNRFENYNEPRAMKAAAIKRGVPADQIVEDFAGRSTYDTCFRAREIFGVSRAILVTQEFHLNRAIYLCESLGIDSLGIAADRRQYPEDTKNQWARREMFAIPLAWLDINVLQPTPILGAKQPIQQ